MLPTFLVIGAMKSGTTSLYEYLAGHPSVFMAQPKELHYFAESMNWGRGSEWYEERFAGAESMPARGEVSPSYSQADIFPGVPERIAELLPDVRLVYLVRQPIERLRSMYLHEVASGRETRPVERAVRERAYYLNASRYAWQLDQHLEFVPAERILVLTTDQLRDDRSATLAQLFAFLGVDPDPGPVSEVRRGRSEDKRVDRAWKHRWADRPGYATVKRMVPAPVRRIVGRATSQPIDPSISELPPSLEDELTEQLRPDLDRLRRFLGPEFDGWGLLTRT